jgi:ribose/xylose/arabinose/galactoside ABC-type transport system permease subunit
LLGLGGFLGGLLGALIGFASSDPVVIGTLGVLVSIAGIAFTWMLTNNMPHENASSALSVGALLNYRKKTWSLGMPIPALAPQMRVGGEIDWQVRVSLLKGRW